MFWHNFNHVASPGVPINPSSVRSLASTIFEKPCRYPSVLEIAVPSATNEVEKGNMLPVSPEEEVHAFVMAIARDIDNKEPTADLDLEIWHASLLSVTFKFCILPSEDDRHFRQVMLRDQAVGLGRALGRSGYQRIHELQRFKERRDKIEGKTSAAKIAECYKNYVKNEAITDGFVDNALTVWSRALVLPRVNQAIQRLEHSYQTASPLNEVTRMHTIVQKCGKSTDNIVWVFESIEDGFRRGYIDHGDCSITRIGYGSNKGLCDASLFKKRLLEYMLNTYMNTLPIPDGNKTALRMAYSDFSSYAKYVRSLPNGPEPDLTWQAGWKQSSIEVSNMIEAP